MTARRKYGHASVEEHPAGSGKYRVRARIDGDMRTIASGLTEQLATETANQYAQTKQVAGLRLGVTLAQFGGVFLDNRERRGLRSIDEDRNRWKSYVELDPIGAIALASLRRADIVEWRDRLLTQTSKRGRKGLGAQTVKNSLNLVRQALAEALDRELVKTNVAKDVTLPRGLATTQKLDLDGILLPDEQQALLSAVPSHQRPAVLFALAMGVRWSEVSWLKWEDVRADAVVICRSKGGKATKSGKPRRLPLSPPARLALESAAALRKKKSEWVFPGPRKGGPRKQAPSQWGKWLAKAGITKHMTFHDVRHTTATSLLAGWWGGEKWSLDAVRKQLGHSSVKVTERYARLLDDLLDQSVQRTTFEMFPQGNGSGASVENQGNGNAFVNRRSRVQVPKLAPNENAALAKTSPVSLGTSWEHSRSPNLGAKTGVADHDETDEWRRWFAENCSHWNSVDDIEKELGRGEEADVGIAVGEHRARAEAAAVRGGGR